MTFHRDGGERGSVLVMAAVLSFGMFVLGLAYLTFVGKVINDVDATVVDSQGRYAAIAGMMEAETYAAINNPGMDYSIRRTNYYGSVYKEGRIIFGGYGQGDYLYNVDYTVEGEGVAYSFSDYEQRYTVSRDINFETYADYLYLSDVERDSVRHVIIRFWTPDTLDGKVHSNDTLHVMGSPRFMKKVTSSASTIDPAYNTAHFDEGLYLNQARINFPDQAEEIRRYNGYHGWGTSTLDSATEITFSGPYIYRRYCGLYINGPDTTILCSPDHIASAPRFLIPASGALFIDGKVYIKADRGGEDIFDPGFVSLGFEGRLTLGSSDTMVVVDNLVYAKSRPDNSVPDSIFDVLGLISENYIMVGEDVGDTVYINAAMAALRGSISVEDIYDYWAENEKQSLFIYGSLAQKNRGIVHTTDYGTRGFIEKDYHYDTRLQKYPPPHFMPTGRRKYVYREEFYPG